MIEGSHSVGGSMMKGKTYIITAGCTYLDIDAYACMAAMSELLNLCGLNAVAYSTAECNYSIRKSLTEEGRILRTLPDDFSLSRSKIIIVDVSDPGFLEKNIPLENVIAVYDHHVGFEKFWEDRIGNSSHISFIGAAATLIFRELKNAGLQYEMSKNTAQLLATAILDNTLNLTSANTTEEDKLVFSELCERFQLDQQWCAEYFLEVQESIEADLQSAVLGDVKTVRNNEILPSKLGQLAVWNGERILSYLPQIRSWFNERFDEWMINIIDIQNNCCYFVCEDAKYKQKIESLFNVHFDASIARTTAMYLRKEIIQKTIRI